MNIYHSPRKAARSTIGRSKAARNTKEQLTSPISPMKSLFLHFRREGGRHTKQNRSNSMSTASESSAGSCDSTVNTCESLLNLLGNDCPEVLVSNILSFAGPVGTLALSQTSQLWNQIVSDEDVWRVLCEEYGKVRRKVDDQRLDYVGAMPAFFILQNQCI